MTEPKKKADWERIEADYRAGLQSVREIAGAQGVSHVAIAKRAKKEGWVRDLNAKIKAKAEALVTTRMVTTAVTTEKAVTDRAIIEANAEVIANIRLAHRRDIGRARTLAMNLLQELEIQSADPGLFEGLADLLHSDEDGVQDRRQELFAKVLSFPGRIDGMKKLAETLKHLVGLEREAYGIAEATKLEVSGPNGMPLKAQELTDDQLAAIVAAGSAGAADSPGSQG